MCCKECGRLFDISINAKIYQDELDLKEKIFSGELPLYECPHCGATNEYYQPFLYFDNDKDFVIKVDNLGDNIAYYEDYIKGKKDNDNKLWLSVTSLGSLGSKIAMLENGLDYRVATLYQLFVEEESFKRAKEQHPEIKVVLSKFVKEDDILLLRIIFEDKDRTTYTQDLKFDKQLYSIFYKKYIDALNNMWTFCFDNETAYMFLEKLHENLLRDDNDIVEFASIECPNGNLAFAYIPTFNEGKYGTTDKVAVMKDGDIGAAIIRRVYRMCRYDVPIFLDCPTVAYSLKDIEIITSKDSNAELGNEDYAENVIAKCFERKVDEVELAKKDVIIGIECVLENVNDHDLLFYKKLINKEFKLPGNLRTKLYCNEYNDGTRYLRVFLNQKDVDRDDITKVVMKFDDVVKIVINSPDRYDGLEFVVDKDEPGKNVGWSQWNLTQYRKNSFMLDSDKMKNLMLNITDKEKEFLQLLSYQCIYKVYVENKPPKKIAEELRVPFDDVDKSLGYGYGRLKYIVLDNY